MECMVLSCRLPKAGLLFQGLSGQSDWGTSCCGEAMWRIGGRAHCRRGLLEWGGSGLLGPLQEWSEIGRPISKVTLGALQGSGLALS